MWRSCMILSIGHEYVHAFQPISPFSGSRQASATLFPTPKSCCDFELESFNTQSVLKMSIDDDGDDDDDEYISDDELGDWRTFRSTLVGNGLSSPEDIDTTNKEENTEGGDDIVAVESNKKEEKQNVSPNVELLFSQSDELAEEYLSGAWAHEAPHVEVGGLVIRLPVEAEIYRGGTKSLIGEELLKRMEIEDEGSSGSSYLSLGGGGGSSSDRKTPELSFSLLAAQTLLWYKKAQTLIEEEMVSIANSANENGVVDPKVLSKKASSLLNIYLDNQDAWQEVCLVTERDAAQGTATGFVLNRPMAFTANRELATIVLNGSGEDIMENTLSASQSRKMVQFCTAFAKNCAVYIGGPNKLEEPAVMIHGYGEIDGAQEIAPGTKVYKGGIDAAMEGILAGKYNPLDFRFFIGRHEYTDNGLDVAVHLNKYQSIACARPIILKQCIQLPKPLWHEVLELCGGELQELSKLEMMKREDLNVD